MVALYIGWKRLLAFYATFNNISIISWQSVLLGKKSEKTTELQVGFFHDKTDHNDIIEILLKVALNTINQT
jgi:hypothetical protein